MPHNDRSDSARIGIYFYAADKLILDSAPVVEGDSLIKKTLNEKGVLL
jgi:hypothetical protein